MKYRLAAFDFDGTLADTLPWFESVMDGVADKYGFRKASAADKAQLRHRSTREIMAFLEVPVWKLPAIMAHVRQLMREIDPAVRMFAGVPAALAQLKAAGLRLAVCSSNSLDNVRRVLGPQTGALIDDYECGADLFGKPAKLARLMARHGVERTRCILIGDEMRDIDAARKAGVMAGSVAWGYNHVDALRARAPDEIFEQVADLAAVLAPGFPPSHRRHELRSHASHHRPRHPAGPVRHAGPELADQGSRLPAPPLPRLRRSGAVRGAGHQRPAGLDASPRGDGPGFVVIEDDRTLLLPDRRGNNRIDSLRNIVADPRVALLFLVPGWARRCA